MKPDARSTPRLDPELSGPHPITRLDADDLDMIVTFVLESGSIKGLALRYGVSYPTMRHRLDELIERVRAAVTGDRSAPLTEYLATLIEEGRIAPDVARTIRDLHKDALRSAGEVPNRTLAAEAAGA